MNGGKYVKGDVILRFLVLAAILISAFFATTHIPMVSSQTNLEYNWPTTGHDESYTEFSPGPAPDKPQVLWSAPVAGYGVGFGSPVLAHDGKVFVESGGGIFGGVTYLYCFNAFTGQQLWSTELTHGGGSQAVILDDQYFITVYISWVGGPGGLACYRISDGQELWYTEIGVLGHPGGECKQYLEGRFSIEMKKYFTAKYDTETLTPSIIAYDLSNPASPPTVAWEKVWHEHGEILGTGGGLVFFGSYHGYLYALDGETGEVVWKSPKIGEIVAYTVTYIDGKVLHASGTTRLTCYDAETGEILWEWTGGPRAFFAFGGAAGYGRYYQHNIDPWGGFVGCWDLETGELMWQTPAHYWIGYYTPALADGKLYITVSDGFAIAGEEEAPPVEFACIDAFTGEKLWSIPYTVTHPTVAFGNLYIFANGVLYCIGEEASPSDWTYFRGNINHPGVAVDQYGPTTLNLQWKFETGGTVTSSPAVVDGKVYIGSHDKHIYCIDVYTGEALWMFETEYRVTSSPAVVNGRVYTGFDDGHVYCLDADTGELVWQTDNIYGGEPPPILIEVSTWQPRSSPIVVNNRVYVGALDGKVYCLDATDGDILWTYETNGPICGSPAYSEGKIYIASTDKTLYCLDANTGNQIWNWTTPKQPWMVPSLFFAPTPIVADGKVFIGGGAAYSLGIFGNNIILVSLNATTGELLWQVDMEAGGFGSNTQSVWTPTYVDGILYVPSGMGVAAYNAANGSELWYQWLGFQVFSSVAYADDPLQPKIYVGCDSYSITALDAETGEVLSVYTTEAQIPSSPAIYDGMIIVGSADHHVYCFGDKPAYCPNIVAWCDWREAYVNETIIVHSRLLPGLPNENVLLTVTKPDGSMLNVSATTDSKGWADFTFTVDQAGEWTWTVWYQGHDKGYITYTYAYTDATPLTVKTTTTQPEQPTPTWPPQIVYIIITAIAIVTIAAIAPYLAKKRKK